MFDGLVEELDSLDINEQKSACIWALELCALKLEELSYLIDHERDEFIKRLSNGTAILGDRLLVNTSQDRVVKRYLEQFEESQDTDMLVQHLRGYLFPNMRETHADLNARNVRELCAAYKDAVIPTLRKQKAIAELVNRLVFRLYGINPVEAEHMQTELREWYS